MADTHTVFIVGGGGREHALAWRLSKSPIVEHIFVCPGNGGTARLAKTTNVSISTSPDFAPLVAFAVDNKVCLHIDELQYKQSASLLIGDTSSSRSGATPRRWHRISIP